jgi:hypothetical protein
MSKKNNCFFSSYINKKIMFGGSTYNRSKPGFGTLPSGTPYPPSPPSDIFEIKQKTAKNPLQIRYTDDYVMFSCGGKAAYLPFNGRTLTDPNGKAPYSLFGSAIQFPASSSSSSSSNPFEQTTYRTVVHI